MATTHGTINRVRRFAVRCATAMLVPRVCALLVCTSVAHAVANDEESYVVVKAGRVITAAKEDFAPGMIVIEDGKITAVGKDIEYPPSAKVIDARNETVVPGFVHPRSRHAMADYKRNGVHGDLNAADEVFLSTMNFDDLLRAGYTTVCLVPDGKGIPGRASAFRTAGPKDARIIDDSAYLHVNLRWQGNDKKTLRDALKKAKEEIQKVETARKEWEEKQKKKKEEEAKKKESGDDEKPEEEKEDEGGAARESGPLNDDNGEDKEGEPPEKKNGDTKKEDDSFKPPSIDPKYQPLVDLIQKKDGARMMVQLLGASSLHHFDDVLEPYDELAHVLYLATSRSTNYSHIVDKLGERKAKVIMRPWVHYLPQTTFRYNLLARLDEAGCEVSVVPHDHKRIEYLRVRQRLADLVRAGLSVKTALKSLTLHPARAIGLGDRLGSIEKDKDADLVFFNGDPLDAHTEVQRVMILGEIVWDAEKEDAQ